MMNAIIIILHLFLLFLSSITSFSIFSLQLEELIEKYKLEDDKINPELSLKQHSCHALIKAILKNGNNAISNTILTLEEKQIKIKYSQMLNKCLSSITPDQIQQVILSNIIITFLIDNK